MEPFTLNPILFIPFDSSKTDCYCGNHYAKTGNQKYCASCLSLYFKNTIGVDISTNPLVAYIKCEQKAYFSCDLCHRLCKYSPFKNIISHYFENASVNTFGLNFKDKLCETLCGKFIYQPEKPEMLCPYCCRISPEWVESTLTHEAIPTICFPWWDSCDQCRVCDEPLEFFSCSQKWCQNCLIIYVGCRYCLTTNMIFGVTSTSQCRKCGRKSFVTSYFYGDIINMEKPLEIEITKINNNIYHQIVNLTLTTPKITEINNISTIDNIYNHVNQVAASLEYQIDFIDFMYCNSYYRTYYIAPSGDYFIYDKLRNIYNTQIKWIQYFHIKNLMEIAEGGYGIIYSATFLGKKVAVKRLFNSQEISAHFLNEVKSLAKCYGPQVIKIHGVTRDYKTKDYMLVMEYANGGNLHNYLQKNFTKILWNEKLYILWKIAEGLNAIHKKNFIHRDFHSGNILLSTYRSWIIGDLGLSQPANSTSSNNEIYGVIPYIAPEIFKGAKFSKESDIYTIGMIMWELTSGCKPFADVEHDTELIYEIIDGKRPEITNDTPECFVNLMKECWDSNPSKRPSIDRIIKITCDWNKNKLANKFKRAESKRLELIQSKKLGPEFCKKPHSGAIFTSRPLTSLISFTNLSSINMNREYITKEYCLDINDIQSKTPYESEYINSLDIRQLRQEYISREYELDIDKDQSLSLQSSSNTHHLNAIYTSRPLNELISTVNSSKKRNIEELEI